MIVGFNSKTETLFINGLTPIEGAVLCEIIARSIEIDILKARNKNLRGTYEEKTICKIGNKVSKEIYDGLMKAAEMAGKII